MVCASSRGARRTKRITSDPFLCFCKQRQWNCLRGCLIKTGHFCAISMSSSLISRAAGSSIERGQIVSLGGDNKVYPSGSAEMPEDAFLHDDLGIAGASVAKGEFVAVELMGGRHETLALVSADTFDVVPGLALVSADGVLKPFSGGSGVGGGAYSSSAFAAEGVSLGQTKLARVFA